jgi:hypothetical protein
MIPEAELDLWRAVLVRSLRDLAGVDAYVTPFERVQLKRRARFWFSSDDGSLGSFRWICEALGLDAGYLRTHLFALPATEFKIRIKTVVPVEDISNRRRRRHLPSAPGPHPADSSSSAFTLSPPHLSPSSPAHHAAA